MLPKFDPKSKTKACRVRLPATGGVPKTIVGSTPGATRAQHRRSILSFFGPNSPFLPTLSDFFSSSFHDCSIRCWSLTLIFINYFDHSKWIHIIITSLDMVLLIIVIVNPYLSAHEQCSAHQCSSQSSCEHENQNKHCQTHNGPKG